MQEVANETKAQKLAAARKKLKEYQNRSAEVKSTYVENSIAGGEPVPSITNSSNVSERSNSENNLIASESGAATPNLLQQENHAANAVESTTVPNHHVSDLSNYFGSNEPQQPSVAYDQHANNLNTIQVLITEKTQLTAELDKLRLINRQKDAEIETLRAQCIEFNQNMLELQKRTATQQQSTEQVRNVNAELQHKLAQSRAHIEDQETHLNELRKQLSLEAKRISDLEQQNKQNSVELEMAQLRIRQLSDEGNGGKDLRFETLTQTQLMYEQQIRDLQAMVQELSHDKEQANIQYQQYVQHLNVEVSSLKEKNNELLEQCNTQREREEQLVTHISGLEREIQKNLSKQDQIRQEQQQHQDQQANGNTNALEAELTKLKEQIADFGLEQLEFQLKIKSQEDRLEALNNELQQKQEALDLMQEKMEHLNEDQPDQTKLLATLESNKVAASRAVTQNIKLKEQLDELELRFVQLTNDKAELVNELDAEVYANREIRQNYDEMAERLRTIDERFKFKDEEMIRLSHENVELQQQNKLLKQKLNRQQHEQLEKHESATEEASIETSLIIQEQNCKDHAHNHDDHHHDHHHEHEHDHQHKHEHGHQHEHEHQHEHGHQHEHNQACDHSHHKTAAENFDACQEAEEANLSHNDACASHMNHHHEQHQSTKNSAHLHTAEAMEKLQSRFSQLITKVADLTDEKQRLEHLVLQLQSETETIGEYIALYQTQRRILKQREYEKSAQMRLLREEREQMQEKISMLNQLVSNLSIELPEIQEVAAKQHLNATLIRNVSIEPTTANGNSNAKEITNQSLSTSHESLSETDLNHKLNSIESQQILSKIQNIITEIKENTKGEVPIVTHTVDQLKCCSGKFEIV